MKCSNDLPNTPSFAFLMATQGIPKFPYIRAARVRQCSHAHMEPMPINECPLGYVMPQPYSSVA
jgi:hypothetical protein